ATDTNLDRPERRQREPLGEAIPCRSRARNRLPGVSSGGVALATLPRCKGEHPEEPRAHALVAAEPQGAARLGLGALGVPLVEVRARRVAQRPRLAGAIGELPLPAERFLARGSRFGAAPAIERQAPERRARGGMEPRIGGTGEPIGSDGDE